MFLTDSDKEALFNTVSMLFDKLKAKLLGRFFTGPRIMFEVVRNADPLYTLEGLYTFTNKMMYGPDAQPDQDRIKKLASISSNYIEVEKLKTLNKVLMAIEGAQDIKEAEEKIQEIMDSATTKVETIVTTETRNVQANAEKEGIEKLSASLGIEDPTVCKLGKVDEKLCKHCKMVWHTDENVRIPKVYKLSELKGGYMDHKNPEPTLAASHPRCRHIITMIPPNYGFNKNGQIEFKGFGYDVYEDQRNKR